MNAETVMSRKTIFTIIFSLAALVVVLIVIMRMPKSVSQVSEDKTTIGANQKDDTFSSGSMPVIENIFSDGDIIAEPIRVSPAAPGSASNIQTFEIRIEGDRFIPNTIKVPKGDLVSIVFTAVDKTYDFTDPSTRVSMTIPRGKIVPVSVGANSVGDFLFYCGICGGPDRGPKGHIVVF